MRPGSKDLSRLGPLAVPGAEIPICPSPLWCHLPLVCPGHSGRIATVPVMGLRRWGWKRTAAVLAAAVVAIAGTIVIVLVTSRPAPINARNLRIPVVDGPHDNSRVVLDATFFTPRGSGRIPAILLAHGFDETKNAVR